MTTKPHQAMEPEATNQVEGRFMIMRLRLAGLLVVTGVLVQEMTLFWNHPLSFIAFLGLGGLAVFVGVVVYLLALISPRRS
jgi:hypothetical protein